MSTTLCTMIEARFAGAHASPTETGASAEIDVEGDRYRTQLVMAPAASVTVELPPTDGFELRLRWNDRWATSEPRAATFDDSFLIETNDLALATMWLDHASRGGLLASRYVSAPHPERHTALLLRDSAWLFEVEGDAVRARRGDAEPSEERMADLLRACLILASRPTHWAHEFGDLARELGCAPGSRFEIGGKPMLRVRHGSTLVTVHVLRRLGRDDPGRLRTLVRAHRHGSGGETLSLVSEAVPRASWPPAGVARTNTLSIDGRAGELLDLAKPSATHVRAHDVEIAFDGLLSDPVRLGAAIELAARWATAALDNGPYR